MGISKATVCWIRVQVYTMASLAGPRSVERHQETASARESSSSGMRATARETTAQGPASPRLRPPYCVCACSLVLASASGTCPGMDCIATHRPVFERPAARGVASTRRLSERPHCDLAMAPGRLEKPPALLCADPYTEPLSSGAGALKNRPCMWQPRGQNRRHVATTTHLEQGIDVDAG